MKGYVVCVYKSIDNGTFERLIELQSSANSYTDLDVLNGETYTYYIIGFDENNENIVLSDEISGIPNINYFNADLIANWDEGHDASAVNNVSVYNDVWGYVANDGTEFALVGGFDGTYIVDVSTNPNNPELVSFIQGSYSSHRDIKTYGNYMYIGTEANVPNGEYSAKFAFADGEYNPNDVQYLDITIGGSGCALVGVVNGDDTLNILDVVLLVNLILDGGIADCGDANGDDTINILDVVLLVNLILAG